MSTEAQRAPVPPRPTTPPPSAQGPAAPSAGASVPQHPTTPPSPTAAVPPPAAPAVPVPTPDTAPPRPEQPPAATRRRPVGAVDLTPRPGAAPPPSGRPHVPHPYQQQSYPFPYRHPVPETPAETTTRLRPVPSRRPVRTATAAACAVLGLGLIGGAATGAWLTSDSSADPAARSAYTVGRSAWHSVPVDTLFPRTLAGGGAGPGGADRVWTRVAVAPDSGCRTGLDPLLARTLGPVGCARMLRATYTDATSSSVTTVGVIFTEGDIEAMKALSTRFTDQHLGLRTDLMPRTYPVKGTVAAGFGDRQRASWTVHVLTEVPVVVFAVSGFADGRTVTDPQPVGKAVTANATTAAAQAGLGHEAKGIADRIERGLRRTITDLTEKPE